MEKEYFLAKYGDEINVMVKDCLSELYNVWHELYEMDREKIDIFGAKCIKHYKDYINSMVESQLSKKEEIRSCILSLINEKNELQMELNVRIPINDSCLLEGSSDPLEKRKMCLVETIAKYREMKNNRLEKYDELFQEIVAVCDRLDFGDLKSVPNFPFINQSLPSEEHFSWMREFLDQRHADVVDRINSLSNLKTELSDVILKLEIHQDLPEQCIALLNARKYDWDVSPAYLLFIRNFIMEQKILLDERLTIKTELMNVLRHVWKIIKIDEDHEISFSERNKLFGIQTLERINGEVERCEIIIKDNISSFIKEIRQEIMKKCDFMGVSINEDKEYFFMDSNDFSVKLFETHSTCLRNLESNIKKYRRLYECIHERNSLWNSWIDVEVRALDKSRFFNNRGGHLLKEEKERNLLEKKLPRIESEIRSLIEQYQKNEGKPFLWLGQSFYDFIQNAHEDLQRKKKDIKKEEIAGPSKRKSPAKIPVKSPLQTNSKTNLAVTPRRCLVDAENRCDNPSPNIAHSSPLPDIIVVSPDTPSVILISDD